MARKKKCECPKGIPLWIVTFGDLMSLLLTFFILLLSMSTIDAKKVDAALGSLSGAMSILDGGVKTEINQEIAQQAATSDAGMDTSQEASSIVSDFNEMIESEGGATIVLEEAEEGFTIQLPSSILFDEGEVRVTNQDSILFLRRIAMMAESMPPEMELNVRGHTDNRPPPPTSVYDTNWELSSARAMSVANILMESGIDDRKITVSGNGEHRPVATNATPEGREQNRRVELEFYARKDDIASEAREGVLQLQDEQQVQE